MKKLISALLLAGLMFVMAACEELTAPVVANPSSSEAILEEDREVKLSNLISTVWKIESIKSLDGAEIEITEALNFEFSSGEQAFINQSGKSNNASLSEDISSYDLSAIEELSFEVYSDFFLEYSADSDAASAKIKGNELLLTTDEQIFKFRYLGTRLEKAESSIWIVQNVRFIDLNGNSKGVPIRGTTPYTLSLNSDGSLSLSFGDTEILGDWQYQFVTNVNDNIEGDIMISPNIFNRQQDGEYFIKYEELLLNTQETSLQVLDEDTSDYYYGFIDNTGKNLYITAEYVQFQFVLDEN